VAIWAVYVVDPAKLDEPGFGVDDLYSSGQVVADDAVLSVRGLAKKELIGRMKLPDFNVERWDPVLRDFITITPEEKEAKKSQEQKNIEALEKKPVWLDADTEEALRFLVRAFADIRFGRPR
jgi:hypothetical protein